MNNQSPNHNHQINSKFQILPLKRDPAQCQMPGGTITKLLRFGKLVIGYWLLFGYWCLVICYSNAYALNLDKLKTYFLAGDYKSAISEGENIFANTSSSSDVDELYYLLGLSYLKVENYLRASDIFEIILKEFPTSKFKEEAELGLGDTYFLREDFTKAQDYYKELIKSNPATKLKAPIYYRLSQVSFKKGDTQAAKEYLDKLKQDFPLSPEMELDKDLCFSPGIYYTVQVGSFTSPTNARNLRDRLIQKGYEAYIEEVDLKDKLIYRVKVGKLKLRSQATQLENQLSLEGYPTKICP